MFWPLEKVPTTRPELLTATDCSWPAAKPFCVMVLMVAAPLELANCVSAPELMLNDRFPSDRLLTVTPGIVTDEPVGEASEPLGLKTKFVPVLTQAVWPPTAVELFW